MVNWIFRLTSAASALLRACHLLITNIFHDYPYCALHCFHNKNPLPQSLFKWLGIIRLAKPILLWVVTTCNLNLLYSAAYVCVSTAGFLWPETCTSSSSWVLNLQLYLNSTVPISYCPHVTASSSGLKQPEMWPFISKHMQGFFLHTDATQIQLIHL